MMSTIELWQVTTLLRHKMTLISHGKSGALFIWVLSESLHKSMLVRQNSSDGMVGYLTSHEAYCLCVGDHSGHYLHTRG